jgi:hypothetical protein
VRSVPTGAEWLFARRLGCFFRAVRAPLVSFDEARAGPPVFDVHLRLNRTLPRAAGGGLDARIRLEGAAGDATVRTVGRRCYAQPVSDSAVPARPGRRVRVALLVAGETVLTARTRIIRGLPARGDADRPYVRRLGC